MTKRCWLPTVSVAVAMTVAAIISACGGGDGASSDSTLPSELAEGRDIYVQRCAVCHGSEGQGGVGPALTDGRVLERYPDVADHLAIVRDGRNAMPAWAGTLSPEEIEAVVRYEREAL